MPFWHRDSAADSHVKGIVDNAVHNGFRDGAIALGVRIDPSVPALGFVLSTKYHRPARLLPTAGLHDFQQNHLTSAKSIPVG